MHCNHCKRSILNQLSSFFWRGAAFGATLLLVGLYYLDMI